MKHIYNRRNTKIAYFRATKVHVPPMGRRGCPQILLGGIFMEQNRLYRSVTNRKICGVCGGLGEYFNIDPTLIRLGGVLLACVSCGTAVVAYFVAAVIIPDPE